MLVNKNFYLLTYDNAPQTLIPWITSLTLVFSACFKILDRNVVNKTSFKNSIAKMNISRPSFFQVFPRTKKHLLQPTIHKKTNMPYCR